MEQERTCLNGRRLIISDRRSFRDDLAASGAIPRVTLLSAWRAEPGSLIFWEEIVEDLLEDGCTYFVCAGDFAEELHDLVDNLIFRQSRCATVATTYHNDDCPSDVINFFVYTTTLEEISNEALLAILEPGLPYDCDLLMSLRNECHLGRR
ncbi:hypothetical protein [Janthinobacterium fluminis]|uniref:DUF7684 domain-containing protein n=1 Tax=Janthinobacterium fluminis TaxID=2987524 RepID=A0ABT5JTI2_9BURK|nr:hypothetical protein [Janthinobacterium fluminis]MDC8756039.1 hypothetical protein [Janthinobacterium fluminis]